MQALARRIGQLVLHPQSTWTQILTETGDPSLLVRRVTVPLVAVGAVCSTLGELMYRLLWGRSALGGAVLGLLLYPLVRLATVFLFATASVGLARSFGMMLSRPRAFQLAVYSTTPVLALGVLNLLPLPLSYAWFLFGCGLGAYTCVMGLGVMSDVAPERRVVFGAALFAGFLIANTLIEVPVRLVVNYAL